VAPYLVGEESTLGCSRGGICCPAARNRRKVASDGCRTRQLEPGGPDRL